MLSFIKNILKNGNVHLRIVNKCQKAPETNAEGVFFIKWKSKSKQVSEYILYFKCKIVLSLCKTLFYLFYLFLDT